MKLMKTSSDRTIRIILKIWRPDSKFRTLIIRVTFVIEEIYFDESKDQKWSMINKEKAIVLPEVYSILL